MIVAYFSNESDCVKIQYYNSETFMEVNVKRLFEHLKSCFANNNIPFTDLKSNLSNSTNYKRGKKAGFETLLRNEASHLLNIDGDICHHAHNSAKKFLNTFQNYIETLLIDIQTETQWCPDLGIKKACRLS